MIQCKDIPNKPILEFLNGLARPGTWFDGFPNSVSQAMPKEVTEKLVRAKMNIMIKRGVISGCSCGCRGDYEITQKGVYELKKENEDD